jgi:hypothetical protein
MKVSLYNKGLLLPAEGFLISNDPTPTGTGVPLTEITKTLLVDN